jgi:hypothetical protein
MKKVSRILLLLCFICLAVRLPQLPSLSEAGCGVPRDLFSHSNETVDDGSALNKKKVCFHSGLKRKNKSQRLKTVLIRPKNKHFQRVIEFVADSPFFALVTKV